ncbi:MAG: hypothetical protein HY243_08125 [Proteobacteria bacterium]|nr:hypothetical protein [Pseudomonadota bacterium]
MFESLATTQTMIALMLFVLMVIAVGQALRWRSLQAKLVYLGQCDVAIKFPRFSNPALMKLDLRDKTADGDRDAFESYEWFVARLVYVLDEALRFWPSSQWVAVADTQLANHKDYFASDYYAKQNYLPHYSSRMRALIEKQRRSA